MTGPDFTTAFSVDQSPKEAYAAIINPRGWWSEEITGGTEKVGDEFNYHYQEFHRCKIRLTESVPGQKVSWLVVENYFSFADSAEWTNTTISFDISEKDGKTHVLFTHHGLNPDFECYNACSEGWGNYIGGSLKEMIEKGEGAPNADDKARTSAEQALDAANR